MPAPLSDIKETDWEWAWRRRRIFTSVTKDVLGGIAGGLSTFAVAQWNSDTTSVSIRTSVLAVCGLVGATLALPFIEACFWRIRARPLRLEAENEELRQALTELERRAAQRSGTPTVELRAGASEGSLSVIEFDSTLHAGRTFVVLPKVTLTNQSESKSSVTVSIQIALTPVAGERAAATIIETYNESNPERLSIHDLRLAGVSKNHARFLDDTLNLDGHHSIKGVMAFWFLRSLRDGVRERLGECSCTYNVVISDLVTGASRTFTISTGAAH